LKVIALLRGGAANAIRFVAVITLSAWCGFASAADAPAAAPPATATTTAPKTPPPTDDVGEWSKQATQRLFEIKERLSGPSEVAAVEQRLEALRSRFYANVGDLVVRQGAVSTLTESAMHDAQREIGVIASATDEISATLTQRSATLEALTREVSTMQKTATTLRASAEDASLPQAFRTRLDMIIADSAKALAITQRRLDGVGALQNQILVLEERMHTAREDLAEAEAARTKALFELQQPPLWRVSTADIGSAIVGSTHFVGQALPGGLQFAQDHPVRILLHLTVFVLGCVAVLFLRRAFDSAAVGAPKSRATSRPFSASMLVALLITPFLYPDAPSSVLQIFGLILVVPLLRILTLYLEPQLHFALYSLIAVFLLERMTLGFARDVVLQRVALLVLNLATIALFAWARSLHVSAHLNLAPRMSALLRRLAVAGIGLSTLSLLFNVLGNVDLAMLLQSTTVRGATFAAGLHAAVLVVDEIAQLFVHSLKARGVRSITNHERIILARTHRVVTVAALVAWITSISSNLRILLPFVATVNELLSASWTIGQITISLGRSLGFVIAVWVAVHASRITQVLLHDDVLPRFALPRGVPNAISTVANYVMVLIGLLIGAGILGIELSNLTLIVSALGVGIGFGLQNVVNNLVSGFILIFERSVQIGDTVQVADLTGKVTQIGLRASRLRTFNGSEVIVPNGELISNRLINWTLSDRRRRLEITVGVAYGSDLEKVHSILRGVLDAETDVLREPEPMVIFEAFGDSTLNFRLYFWIQDLDIGFKVIDRVNTAIARAFDATGIEIPFPQTDLHVRTLPK
jgi:potassium-dependent mechanosensitive channel